MLRLLPATPLLLVLPPLATLPRLLALLPRLPVRLLRALLLLLATLPRLLAKLLPTPLRRCNLRRLAKRIGARGKPRAPFRLGGRVRRLIEFNRALKP